MHTLSIEIWSDFSCPFCYIAKKNFSDALTSFSGKHDIALEFRAFQLDPDFEKPSTEYSLLEHISKKYGQSHIQTQRMFDDIERKGKESNLEIRFDKVIHANTFLAHKLLKYSQEFGKSQEMVDLLFEAYFRDGMDIGDRNSLEYIAKKVGILASDFSQVFDVNSYESDIIADIHQALEH